MHDTSCMSVTKKQYGGKIMNFASLLKNTHLLDMIGTYTGVTTVTLCNLYKNYLKPIYDYRGWSDSDFYKEIDMLGVNDFIDKYFNFHCLELVDVLNEDESFECAVYLAPNDSYIPERLQADLNCRYKKVFLNKEKGFIECSGRKD